MSSRRRAAPVPVAVRAVVLLAGVLLAVVPERLTTAGVVAVLVGVVAALVAPRVVGSTLVTAVFVLVWVAATGWDAQPSVARTASAALALYVLHTATALSACLPLSADVSRGVLTRWLRGMATPLVLAAAVVMLDELIPQQQGPAVLELLGLVGVAVLAVVAACALLRRTGPR